MTELPFVTWTGVLENKYLNDVASTPAYPFLNMQDEIYHPFQCLADLMTILEKKGRDLRKKKMVVSWLTPLLPKTNVFPHSPNFTNAAVWGWMLLLPIHPSSS
jgi:ornithine carbamoyltransferase